MEEEINVINILISYYFAHSNGRESAWVACFKKRSVYTALGSLQRMPVLSCSVNSCVQHYRVAGIVK